MSYSYMACQPVVSFELEHQNESYLTWADTADTLQVI